jgi:hypothetical protein
MSESLTVRTTFAAADLEMLMREDSARVAAVVHLETAEAALLAARSQLVQTVNVADKVGRLVDRRMAPIGPRGGRIVYPLVRDEGQR